MNETVNFNPVDNEMKVRMDAIIILNRFKLLGFNKREAFIYLINEHLPEYNVYPKFRALENFWSGRFWNAKLNNDLLAVLENLKNS